MPHTPLEVKKIPGWGTSVSLVRAGESRPIFNSVKPKEYYTDFVKTKNLDGKTVTVLSDKRAEEAGNHVATPEIRAAIDEKEFEYAQHLVTAVNSHDDLVEALLLAKSAMNELGDRLNGIDAADPESVERLTPTFEAVSSALAKAGGQS